MGAGGARTVLFLALGGPWWCCQWALHAEPELGVERATNVVLGGTTDAAWGRLPLLERATGMYAEPIYRALRTFLLSIFWPGLSALHEQVHFCAST